MVKTYPVKDASARGASETLENYMTTVAPNVNENFTHVQLDPGSQFTSAEWSQTCVKFGVKSRYCPVDHQAMNGQVERVQGLLAEKIRTLLASGKLHVRYWPLALETATYLLNRTPHTALGGQTPLEVATGKMPNLDNARVFGCAAYVQIPKAQRKGKFADTAWRGILVGYSTDSPEWLVLHPRTNNIRKAYSVKFNEYERRLKGEQGSQWEQIFDDFSPEGHKVEVIEETPPTLGPPCEHITSEVATISGEHSVGQQENANTCTEESNKIPNCLEGGDNTPEDMSEMAQHEAGQQGTDPTTTNPESPVSSPANSSSADESCDSSWGADDNDKANNQMGKSARRSTRARWKFDPNHVPSGTLEMETLTK